MAGSEKLRRPTKRRRKRRKRKGGSERKINKSKAKIGGSPGPLACTTRLIIGHEMAGHVFMIGRDHQTVEVPAKLLPRGATRPGAVVEISVKVKPSLQEARLDALFRVFEKVEAYLAQQDGGLHDRRSTKRTRREQPGRAGVRVMTSRAGKVTSPIAPVAPFSPPPRPVPSSPPSISGGGGLSPEVPERARDDAKVESPLGSPIAAGSPGSPPPGGGGAHMHFASGSVRLEPLRLSYSDNGAAGGEKAVLKVRPGEIAPPSLEDNGDTRRRSEERDVALEVVQV